MSEGKVRTKGTYVLDAESCEKIYGQKEREAISRLIEVYDPQTASSVMESPEMLAEAEVILSGWGAPLMDEAFLDSAPKLRAVFYGAGSIRDFVTRAFWERGVQVTSAYAANAVPV